MPNELSKRAVLVGLGNIGLGYDLDLPSLNLKAGTCLTHARALAESDSFLLQCGVDPNPAATAAFESIYGCEAVPRIYEAPRDAEVVVVAVPTLSHVEVIEQVLTTLSPTFVICEKPLGASESEARVIDGAVRDSGAHLIVNYFRQYLPSTQKIGLLLSGLDSGNLMAGTVFYSHGLRQNASHFVRLLLEWLGPATYLGMLPRRRGKAPSLPSFSLEFERGVVDFISVASHKLRMAEVTLVFETGILSYALGGMQARWHARSTGMGIRRYDPHGIAIATEFDTYQKYLYEWIAKGPSSSALSVDVDQAVAVQAIMDEVVGESLE